MSSSEASSSSSEFETTDKSQRGSKKQGTFEPPHGAVLMDGPDSGGAIEAGEFEWDSINNDKNIELWLVRIPNSIKPRHLNDSAFDAPSSSSTHTLGQVKRKHETYDLWSLGDRDGRDVDYDQIGGDEMKGISCLLPRKSTDGKLYLGPKPITRRLILAASPPTPNIQNPTTVLHQNPPRHSYPVERFKHRYTPYGTTTTPAPPVRAVSPKDPHQEPDRLTPPSPKARKRSKLIDGQKKTARKSKAGKP